MSFVLEDATNSHFPILSIDIHVGCTTVATGFPPFPASRFPALAIVFRYIAPSLVARYKNFPFGVPAIAVGSAGAAAVELGTVASFPEAIAKASIVLLLAFAT
jgi:hypothetical protein